ncbi:hypothetical protein NDU88_002241 [Pleurodeles waltl]|uniref:Uncharacterized protein n=1 Tax=Pleurodeles waltl TaxID=8319 RepID=A0AAV7U8Q3_PLEWA|nr:hypothetical protein NDU88_002241 [Pleurodeles waltl]
MCPGWAPGCSRGQIAALPRAQFNPGQGALRLSPLCTRGMRTTRQLRASERCGVPCVYGLHAKKQMGLDALKHPRLVSLRFCCAVSRYNLVLEATSQRQILTARPASVTTLHSGLQASQPNLDAHKRHKLTQRATSVKTLHRAQKRHHLTPMAYKRRTLTDQNPCYFLAEIRSKVQ